MFVACRSSIVRAPLVAVSLLASASWLAAACGGQSGEETASSNELRGVVCGVERAAEIAELACAYGPRRCELLVPCCSAAGYSSAVEDCAATSFARCEQEVRAFLQAGSCFDADRFNPSCDDRLLTYEADCRAVPVLTAAFREDYTERCPSPWTKGNLGEGSTCIQYSQQCAEPDPEMVTYCIPTFDTPDTSRCESFVRRAEGEACSTLDSCADGTRCNSSGVCAFPQPNGGPCSDGFLDCDSGTCVAGSCVDFIGQPCEAGCVNGICGADGRCEERPLANEVTCSFTP
jgi:hypothetical protein